jgi:hypothetical protein
VSESGLAGLTTGGRPSPRSLALITAAGFFLGLWLAPRVFHNYDVVDCFLTWARASGGRRPWDIYLTKCATRCDYPPLVPYLLTLVEAARRALRVPEPSSTSIVLLKLPGILAYVAAVPLCALGLRKPLGAPRARTAALLAALSLPVFVNAAAWGQFDALLVLLLMAAVVALLHERPIAAGVMMGLALATKVQAVVAVPVLAAWTWRRFGAARLALAMAVALAVVGLLASPYVVAGAGPHVLRAYTRAVDYYPLRSVDAYNGWYLLDRFDTEVRGLPAEQARLDSQGMLGPLTFRSAGFLALAAYTALLLVPLVRRPRPQSFVFAAALGFFGFFMLSTQMHERYLVPAAALLGLSAASSRMLPTWAGVSLTASLNQALELARAVLDHAVRVGTLTAAGANVPAWHETIRLAACVVAVTNIVLFVRATWVFWREATEDPPTPGNEPGRLEPTLVLEPGAC